MTIRSCGHPEMVDDCEECIAYRVKRKRLRIERERGGPIMVDATPYRRLLEYAEEAGLTPYHIAKRAKLHAPAVWRIRTGDSKRMNRLKLAALVPTIDKMCREREEAISDLRAAVRFIKGERAHERVNPRWLRDEIQARGMMHLLSDNDRRMMFRDTIDAARMEQIALSCHIDLPDDFGAADEGTRAVCGTKSAYVMHRRNGEEPCDACREANTAYQRELRAR